MRWVFRTFAELDTNELLALLKLRVDVFVVEQACAYPEIDHHDNAAETLHLLGYDPSGKADELVAYCRSMPDAQRQEVRIGRVVIAPTCRRRGLARTMMLALMRKISALNYDLVLSAQTEVIDFYTSLGFVIESDEYVEDGIPHIDMRLRRALP